MVVRALAVADGVEAEAHPVVVEHVVAAADVGAHLGRLGVEAVEGEVEVAVVVDGADLGLLRQLVAVQRVVGQPLGEGERRRPARPRRPARRRWRAASWCGRAPAGGAPPRRRLRRPRPRTKARVRRGAERFPEGHLTVDVRAAVWFAQIVGRASVLRPESQELARDLGRRAVLAVHGVVHPPHGRGVDPARQAGQRARSPGWRVQAPPRSRRAPRRRAGSSGGRPPAPRGRGRR